MRQFDFGENWVGFSTHALTAESISESRAAFGVLMAGVPLKGCTFLDIGFGQGLIVLMAQEQGAKVSGCDINEKCVEAYRATSKHFVKVSSDEPHLVVGSILDDGFVQMDLLQPVIGERGYDVVHSWGVLHHTGDMAKAMTNAASLVKPGGYFVIAIYNRHWSSRPWLFIKWFYNLLPRFLQPACCWLFTPVIWLAKLLVTGKNPLRQERGMDFYYNVVDWVGGYPYEYGSIGEIEMFLDRIGFKMIKAIPAAVPTGCNEFVFLKNV
ncbi:MAG: class I SAM-dependent methyltransferase [Sulfuritalea sp.]|nr:class I SAM-dependent methyltransferase [Sulfuritalea sp.]